MKRTASTRSERGALAPAVPILAFMLLLLGGLGIDGSRDLNARGEAVAYAEEAARAGAQQVDLNSPDLTLLEPQALAAAQKYCDAAKASQPTVVLECRPTGIQEVSDTDHRRLVVRVFCRTEVTTTLLHMVGVQTLSASGFGSARPYEGIDKPVNEP